MHRCARVSVTKIAQNTPALYAYTYRETEKKLPPKRLYLSEYRVSHKTMHLPTFAIQCILIFWNVKMRDWEMDTRHFGETTRLYYLFLRNVCNHLPRHAASHCKRPKTSVRTSECNVNWSKQRICASFQNAALLRNNFTTKTCFKLWTKKNYACKNKQTLKINRKTRANSMAKLACRDM